MRILISNPDTIGDFILRQPMLAALSARGHELLLIVRNEVAPLAPLVAREAKLLTLDADPYVPKSLWNRWSVKRLLAAAAAFRPERLVLAPYQWTRFEEDLVSAFPGVPRVSMRGKLYRGRLEDGVDERTSLPLVDAADVPEDLLETKKNERLTSAILGEAVTLPAPKISASVPQLDLASAKLESWKLQPGAFWVACVGHAAHTALRNWPEKTWSEVLSREAAHGRRFVLVGSADELPVLEFIRMKMGERAANAFVSAGADATLDLLAGLIAHSAGYVGRDTGPMHLAAALGKPVVALFGGGTWPRFLPASRPSVSVTVGVPCVGCGWICHLPESYCVKRVPAAEIEKAIKDVASGRVTDGVARVIDPGPELLSIVARESAHEARERKRSAARLEAETKSLTSDVLAAETARRDVVIKLESCEGDRKLAYQFGEQKEAERARAAAERDGVIAELAGVVAAKESQKNVMQQRIDELGRLIELHQGRAGALLTSRWMKLGKKLKLAKPFPWEGEY